MKVSPRPVIVGVGQFVNRCHEPAQIKDPFEMIEMAVHCAEEDSGVASLAKKVDGLCLVNILSASHPDPPRLIAERIGARPSELLYTWVGASAPQWFVNRGAERIATGRWEIALICGGEAFHSRRLARAMGKDGWWAGEGFPKSPRMVGDMRDPLTSLEIRYGMVMPIHVYPLFENALRHQESLSLEEHRKEIGGFCSRLSRIAATNPYAWFRDAKGSDEITSISPENRMVCFPYTKFMCSIMDVDQSAALFMTDEETARGLGIPRHKWVYLRGCGDASDLWYVSQRIAFHSSPSVKVAAEKAMEMAGVSMEEIKYLDFYSCFPCAPRIAGNMLGISRDDPRPITVTGGMPYFGGPGNSYSLHAICRMVEILRQEPQEVGMVQALSWFISKHSVGIYSGSSPEVPYKPVDPKTYQKELDLLKGPELVEEASGKATLETYTVIHDRDGRPVSSIIIGRLEDGRRFLASGEDKEDVYREMMEREVIGEKGTVNCRQGVNVFIL